MNATVEKSSLSAPADPGERARAIFGLWQKHFGEQYIAPLNFNPKSGKPTFCSCCGSRYVYKDFTISYDGAQTIPLDDPDWLKKLWTKQYGSEAAAQRRVYNYDASIKLFGGNQPGVWACQDMDHETAIKALFSDPKSPYLATAGGITIDDPDMGRVALVWSGK